MIKKIKVTFSEKLLFTFLIILSLVFFSTYFLLKDKCLFVNKVNSDKLIFKDPKNIAIMNIECGNVIIELYPEISPNAVKRFKTLIKNKSYDGSAFYKVIKNTLVQAGDLEFGNINNLNYTKIGTGNSGLGSLNSELNENFEFLVGSVALARKDELDTEDSEFFIILKEIPIYQGEYTPVGKVIYGLDALQKIKLGNKSNYVLRPDYINYFKLLD